MAEQHSAAAAPLLGNSTHERNVSAGTHIFQDSRDPQDEYSDADVDGVSTEHWSRRMRRACGRALASRRKHFIIMAIVALDVVTLLANIFIQLISCEMHQSDEPWVETVTTTLEVIGLVFSTVFMLELIACIYAFGWGYLASAFHLFDAAIIVLSFLIDVSLRGPAESIGSLLVVLRLWRLAKISEEVVLGAAERMEMLEHHIDDLEAENKHLRALVKSHEQGRDLRQH